MPMVDYIRIKNLPTQGKTVPPDSLAYQAIVVLLEELVRPIFAEQGFGQEVTVEVTLKITPAPRGGGAQRNQRR
jgi:hypothetical protein